MMVADGSGISSAGETFFSNLPGQLCWSCGVTHHHWLVPKVKAPVDGQDNDDHLAKQSPVSL